MPQCLAPAGISMSVQVWVWRASLAQITTGWSGTVALIKSLDFALVTEEEPEAANSKINQLARPLAHSLSNLDGLVSRQA